MVTLLLLRCSACRLDGRNQVSSWCLAHGLSELNLRPIHKIDLPPDLSIRLHK